MTNATLLKGCTAALALACTLTTPAQAQDKTIAFSPIALSIPAMQGLSGAVGHFAEEAGLGFVSLDPKFDPGQQAQQLNQVIETGKVQGAWAIAVRAAALRNVVQTAIKKQVPIIVTGHPADYGFDGLQPGVTFSAINYSAYGSNLGGELASCINEKLNGTAEVFFFGDASGSQSAQETDGSAKAALATISPAAAIVGTAMVAERLDSQNKAAQLLQANPNANAVYASNDENAMGALSAFKAAGKELPCLVTGGGGDEALAALEAGELYAIAGFDFKGDARQNFETLLKMMEDPTAMGLQLEIPIKITK